MNDETASTLGQLDGPNEQYPPYDKVVPYPQFLVINIYAGHEIVNDRTICITAADQYTEAQRLQAALAQRGFQWHIHLATETDPCQKIGASLGIEPLEKGLGAYEIDIDIFGPDQADYQNGSIHVLANDAAALTKAITTLIQVIQLSFEFSGDDIASLWIRDWQ